ncbi:SMP-30/gluconolactonase/LRE family protein [Paractinoplanes globisporus]|uniref:SMP-30/gluconolactonase/LRE family protein n=1 Tax=Paractinoplanes globisporus TaxID=113565 RepID=A0ABW6W9A5_9ACTN|nr:SMP-30/gluconolactonase/LRE family protein [Actinoplanes globisporus]
MEIADLVSPGATVERLGGGATWSEGPLWLPGEDAVIWSDIPGNRILRWSAATGGVTVDRTGVEFTNGRTFDREGRIVTCSHGRRAIERDGRVLVDHYGPSLLNSPNDVVVASDGAIWFTDPPYGIVQPAEGYPGELEYGACYVFRFDPATGDLTPVVLDMEEPNGLAFSPDESLLYVADTSAALHEDGKHWIRVYDVVDGRGCANGRLFAEVSPGVPDGFRVDEHGNVWTSSADSVQVYAPDGRHLGKIPVPEVVANVCFGGPDGDTLFIAATTSLYRLQTSTRSA